MKAKRAKRGVLSPQNTQEGLPTLSDLKYIILWMGASQDFCIGGQARKGWEKDVKPLLARIDDEVLEREDKRRAKLEQIKNLGNHACYLTFVKSVSYGEELVALRALRDAINKLEDPTPDTQEGPE